MIYFYVYPSAFQNPGGGEVLLLKTQEYLEKSGVKVKLFDLWQDRFKEGDILHVFGSVKEALGLMQAAKERAVRIVHSPIIWYNWQSSFKIPYAPKERALCLLRQAAKFFLPQLPSDRKRMIHLADRVLAGSYMEAQQIRRYFLVSPERLRTAHYGVDPVFAEGDAELFTSRYGVSGFVLMAGRIEPRKNQLSLIRAMKGLAQPLVIAGSPVSHHADYAKACRREAGKNVHFIGPLEKDSPVLCAAYAACDVFALPTWFETPGLAALEAGVAGAKLVVTREGSTREYFGALADYVNPASVKDIRQKVLAALDRPKDSRLSERIRGEYLWEHCAFATLEVYKELGFSK